MISRLLPSGCSRRHRVCGGIGAGGSTCRCGRRAVNIKLDENLPHHLIQLLTDLGHDVDTVREEQLAGRHDEVVWAAAQAAGRVPPDAGPRFLGLLEARTIPSCIELTGLSLIIRPAENEGKLASSA